MSKSSIVFFGSGPVAAKSLSYLQRFFHIEAVFTKPQPLHHRTIFPVLSVAKESNLRVFTPSSKKEISALIRTATFESALGIVIDYGFIIENAAISAFPRGIINSHFSLLPEWRGADPITFALLSGQKSTGVSLMLINEKMDEGELLSQADYVIKSDDTNDSLTESLIEISIQSLEKIIPLFLADETSPAPQEKVTMAGLTQPLYSRKLTKKDGDICLRKPATALEREIRAFQQWPKSRTQIHNLDVIITKAHVGKGIINVENKTTFISGKQLCLQTSDGVLVIDELKPVGKGVMSSQAFLAGYGAKL